MRPDRPEMVADRVVAALALRHRAYAPPGIELRTHQVTYDSLRLVLIDDAAPEQVSDVRGERINLAPVAIKSKREKRTVFEPEVLVEPALQFGRLAL